MLKNHLHISICSYNYGHLLIMKSQLITGGEIQQNHSAEFSPEEVTVFKLGLKI